MAVAEALSNIAASLLASTRRPAIDAGVEKSLHQLL
jgi:hypothetical protein